MKDYSKSENYATGSNNCIMYDPTKLIGCFVCGSLFGNLKDLESHECERRKDPSKEAKIKEAIEEKSSLYKSFKKFIKKLI